MDKFTCIQKCPELDYDNSKHCTEKADGYCHKFYEEHGCCPVGNTPKWEKQSDNKAFKL